MFDKDGKLDDNKLKGVEKEIEYYKVMAAYLLKSKGKNLKEEINKWKDKNKGYIENNKEYINQVLIEK